MPALSAAEGPLIRGRGSPLCFRISKSCDKQKRRGGGSTSPLFAVLRVGLRSHELHELDLAAGDVVDGRRLLRVAEFVELDLAGYTFVVDVLQRVPHHSRIVYPGLGDGLQQHAGRVVGQRSQCVWWRAISCIVAGDEVLHDGAGVGR